MTASKDEYIPGVCNIGPAEIKKRRRLGWSATTVTLALAAVLVATRIAPSWRLLLFFPVTLAAIGFLQSAWHFCAKFGLNGVFRLGPGRNDTVAEAEFRRQDRRTALKIIGLSALAGAVIALSAYLLPF